ncbi:MAG: lysophospholipid acyltransferase family protein [Phycisphaerales bacterium]
MLGWYARRHAGSSIPGVLFFDVLRFITTMFTTLVWRYRAYHGERVPRDGPVLIVANHQSYLDPIIVGQLVPSRQIDSVAREGLFRVPGLAQLMRGLHGFPIREDGEPDSAAIREILARLERGLAVVIYPEGTRTLDGRMTEFKRGAALVVKRAKCPVLPVAIEGAHDAWARGRSRPRFWGARIMTIAGEPIPHDELLADGPDAALRRLEREIDAMRLDLRAKLRARTRNAYPPPGPADNPSFDKST